jgi:hypothetical protein
MKPAGALVKQQQDSCAWRLLFAGWTLWDKFWTRIALAAARVCKVARHPQGLHKQLGTPANEDPIIRPCGIVEMDD